MKDKYQHVSNTRAYVYKPVLVFPTDNSDLKVVQIKAHANISFALCSNGKVYSWGQNKDTKTTKQLLGREK